MGLEVMIEQAARMHIEKHDGVLLKFVSPGHKGVPDRVASHIACGPFWMEFKAPGKRLELHQQEKCKELSEKGFRVYTGEDWWGVNSIKMAIEIIDDEIHRYGYRHWPLGWDGL
jgi:hypothetical protein